MLFAEADWLAGAGGWGGAGLLGLVLGWLLLRHLPAKDAQLKELMTDKDNHAKALVADHQGATKELIARNDAALKLAREDYKESLKGVQEHCERETMSLSNLMGKEVSAMSAKIGELEKTVRELQIKVKVP